MREKKKKKLIILSLIGILFVMSAGYAVFNSNLSIKGTSNITSNWDIKITSVTIDSTSGSGKNVNLDFNNLTANMEADLYEKGDSVTYNVVIENNGTFDAKLDNIEQSIKEENEAVKISFSGYTKGQTLKKNTSQTIKVTIEYNKDYSGEGKGSKEVSITFDYNQNEGGTITPTDSYLVTYDCTTNGGEDCSNYNEYLEKGQIVNLTYTNAKTGYIFIGWNTDSSATEGLTELTVEENDITLYAIYKEADPPTVILSTSSTTNSITAVANASDENGTITKYEFSKDGGTTWIDNGTSNVYTFTDLKKDYYASDILKDKVVTSGDGLYADSTESGRYVYKGASPNNYITLGTDTYRIMAVESDGILKVIKNELIGEMYFDDADSRMGEQEYVCNDEGEKCKWVFVNENVYCNKSLGCNVWGSKTTTLDSSGNNTTQMPETVGGTLLNLPETEASLNTYLNGEWYSALDSSIQNIIVSHIFNIGSVEKYGSSQTLSTDLSQEQAYKWRGKVGLMNVTDYVKASTNSACTRVYSYNILNSSCYKDIGTHNWIFGALGGTYLWTITPLSGDSTSVFAIDTEGYFDTFIAHAKRGIKLGVAPVFYLSSDIFLSGSGTESDPYKIGDEAIYNIKTRVTSSTTKTAEDSKETALKNLEEPTYIEEGTSTGTNVTIDFNYECGSTYTCSYSKDGGNFIEVTKNPTISFTGDGTLVAKISDGTNTVSSSYTVTKKVYSVSFTPNSQNTYTQSTNVKIKINFENELASNQSIKYAWSTSNKIEPDYSMATGINGSVQELIEKVVTSGDGLYVDSTESGRYVYKGASPDNYITIGSDTYRIISVESDGNLKVIKNTSIGRMQFDDAKARNNQDGYCRSEESSDDDFDTYIDYSGCNIWGSKTTMMDSSGNYITKMPISAGNPNFGTYDLPDDEAYINTYLNNTWYNTLSSSVKKIINSHYWDIQPYGPSYYDDYYMWFGKIGLITRSDLISATTSYPTLSWINELAKSTDGGFWTMTPYGGTPTKTNAVYGTYKEYGWLYEIRSLAKREIYPVFYISASSLDGSGTEDDPYVPVSGSTSGGTSEGQKINSKTITVSSPNDATGTYYLWVKGGVKDTAGNETETAVSGAFHFDNTDPTCTTTGGSDKWSALTQTLTGTCFDEDSGCSESMTSETFSVASNVKFDDQRSGTINEYKSPGKVTDNAGNTTTCPTAHVKVTGITLGDYYQSNKVFIFDGKTGLSDSTWKDQSGNGRNGTLVDDAKYDSINDCVTFNGSSSYVRIANKLDYSSVTLETVYKPTNVSKGHQQLVSNIQKGGYSLAISRNGNSEAEVYKSGAYRFAVVSNVKNNNIYYLSGRMNKKYQKAYDGNSTVTSYDQSGVDITTTNHDTYMVLGTNPYENKMDEKTETNETFEGCMYAARMYSTELSDDQLQKHYVIDKARYGIGEK